MARDRLFQIKKWITVFFAVVIMVQAGFVCYASATPISGDVAAQLSRIERLGQMLVAGLALNLVVALVAAYGFNVSIVNSYKCK